MNFDLSEEQRHLRDSVQRVLADHYGFAARHKLLASGKAYSEEAWRLYGELGLTALLVPHEYGGLGGKVSDALPVLEEFGKALVLEPYQACMLGAMAVLYSGDKVQCARLLPGVSAGETLLAFAHEEAEARGAVTWVQTTARRTGDRWHLDGVKINVLHGQFAEHVIVSARVEGKGAPDDVAGLRLFLCSPKDAGTSCEGFRLVDGTPAAAMSFEGTPAVLLGALSDEQAGMPALQKTLDAGIAFLCVTALGAMEAAYTLTLSYLNTRKQFGRLIGENQSLRHRAAEMKVRLEMCRSMAIAAAVAADAATSRQNSLDLSRAKSLIGRQGREMCHDAIQLHGGIGITEEYAVGHYLRSLTVMDHLLGDQHAHSKRVAALLCSEQPEQTS